MSAYLSFIYVTTEHEKFILRYLLNQEVSGVDQLSENYVNRMFLLTTIVKHSTML